MVKQVRHQDKTHKGKQSVLLKPVCKTLIYRKGLHLLRNYIQTLKTFFFTYLFTEFAFDKNSFSTLNGQFFFGCFFGGLLDNVWGHLR